MALRPLTGRLFVRQSCRCLPVLCQSRRSSLDVKNAELRREKLEEQKSLSRRVYEKLGFQPPYLEKSEHFEGIYKIGDKVYTPENDPLYQEDSVFVFDANCRLQEGVAQSLWLTKSVLMEEKMPKAVADSATSIQIPDMEQRLLESIRSCRQFDTEGRIIKKTRYCYTQGMSLLRLCNTLSQEHCLNRMTTEDHYVATFWDRDDDRILVKGGPKGLLVSCRTPLTAVASREEVEATKDMALPTFHPLSPTIDLCNTNIYMPNENNSGFNGPSPFPHTHTRISFNTHLWMPVHSISRAIMFTFADGFARAKQQYGMDYCSELDTPIVVQGIENNGVDFTFITVQINTLDMQPNDGVRNMVWLDQGNALYEDMYPQDFKLYNIGKSKRSKYLYRILVKDRKPETGCQNLDVTVFQKFLAFIANK